MKPSPQWPKIGCAISLLILLVSINRRGAIEAEARPYILEAMRMETGTYAAQVNTEAFLRGYLYGDAFGKAYEEQTKGQNLQYVIAHFESRYSTATLWRNISLGTLLGFGIVWGATSKRKPAAGA